MKAVYPGSFDPFTKGHLDILRRSVYLFEEIHVVVMNNREKKHLFTGNQRKGILQRSVTSLQGELSDRKLFVSLHSGIISDYITEHEIDIVVRGIRNATDLNHEMQLEQYLRRTTDVETVYLSPMTENLNTSSTLVRMFLNTGKMEQAHNYIKEEAWAYIKNLENEIPVIGKNGEESYRVKK